MIRRSVPIQASRAGFNTLVFYGVSNVDVSDTRQPGFNWYIARWFGLGTTSIDNINVDSFGNLVLGGGSPGAVELQSAIYPDIGTVFYGGGYFEVELSLDSPGDPQSNGSPAFFLESFQHVIGKDQWPGQPAGYVHFGEADVVEISRSTLTSYLGAIHDWSGMYSPSSGFQYNIQNNGSVWQYAGGQSVLMRNKYGLLWQPQTKSHPGHLSWYFNDKIRNTIYYKGPVTAPPLAGQGSGTWDSQHADQAAQTYAVIDTQGFAMRVQTDSTWPMTVYSVKVWK